MGVRVAVAGASGYAGGELLRLLAAHPGLDVVAATAHGQAGVPLGQVHPQLVSYGDLILGNTTVDELAKAELVFLALPHGASAGLAAQLPSSVKIVDLGADFRLRDAAAWQRYYGGSHAGSWTYGLPELPGQRAEIAAADRVANTGCYAVAVILALAPLIAAGLIEPTDVVVVASSGTSGAGRSAKANLLGSEVMSDLSAYKVGAHQHVPEILQATGAETLSMTPVLAPMPRGILAAVTARPTTAGVTAEDVLAVLSRAYADEPFVHVLLAGRQPHTAATFGSNSAHLQAAVDLSSGRVILTSAIDNLGKGAAGQAVQNANLMLGMDETAGLSANGVAP
ncbi:N-acetyl-gamma-glutamyl-phosphate reductase [Jatrophihabitans lederbergiae]|uniref:N-acetyl-gamma-glutamyl-phosphate reductase n=1 Tax=Jatrophihabitans lederbergiae TaxID=3075547 RepID=A0ABU2J715_9ACTN|nr:N-acetyl-gamma-glutamyl-phosphate reductase [Jatrophihabitans sp. DSM 44399]MDT0260048.1 N-acetyl-gamma-glutamyl-phosphate reductase [Jatrophihabitans sp. DSM 44399]